jgi:hypothetical protein
MGFLVGSVVVALAILAARRRAPASQHQDQGRGLTDLFCHGVSCGDVAPGALSSVCDPADPLKKFQPAAAKVAEATRAASAPTAARRAPVPVLPTKRTTAIPRFMLPYYRNSQAL